MRRWDALLVLLAALIAAAAALLPVWDGDAFYHLAAGRLVWDSGIPQANTFSYTFADFPWQDPEWLFQLLLYLSYLAGGYAGVGLMQSSLIGGAFAFLWLAARRRTALPDPLVLATAGLPLLLTTLIACRFRFSHRPEIASFFFLALLFYLWERRPRRLPLWLLLAGILWSNLHPGVFFGLTVCLVYLLDRILCRDRAGAAKAVLAAAAFASGSLLNPYFLYPYAYLWEHPLLFSRFPISEMQSTPPWERTGFSLLALLSLVVIPWRWRARDYPHLLLVALFLPAALLYRRQVPLFLLAAFPGSLAALSAVFRTASGRGWKKYAALAAGAAMLAGSLILAVSHLAGNRASAPPGLGLNLRRLPEGAVRIIEQRNLSGPLFNDYYLGGYLIWRCYPRLKVFVDQRTFAYPMDFLQGLRYQDQEELRALVDGWKTDLAVVLWHPEKHFAVAAGSLFEDMGWDLIHMDGVCRMYVRPGSPDAGRTRDLVFSRIRNASTDMDLLQQASRDPLGTWSELARIDPHSLSDSFDFNRFGTGAYAAGDLQTARAFFTEGLALSPGNQQLRFNLALVLADLGGARDAISLLRKVRDDAAPGSELAVKADEEIAVLSGPRRLPPAPIKE